MLRIEAADGPTRARPAKNSRIAATVLTRARVTSQPQPADEKPSEGPPRSREVTAYVVAAPLQISAVSGSGAMPPRSRSPMRMYAEYTTAAVSPRAMPSQSTS